MNFNKIMENHKVDPLNFHPNIPTNAHIKIGKNERAKKVQRNQNIFACIFGMLTHRKMEKEPRVSETERIPSA